jgi:hypothetical protein
MQVVISNLHGLYNHVGLEFLVVCIHVHKLCGAVYPAFTQTSIGVDDILVYPKPIKVLFLPDVARAKQIVDTVKKLGVNLAVGLQVNRSLIL